MIALFRMNRIGYKLDAVISGFAIGAGFSVVENALYLTLFPDYAHRHLAGARLRNCDHARHDARLPRRDRARVRRARRPAKPPADYHFSLLWFVPGYARRGRPAHGVQPVPGTAAGGDARRRSVRADPADRDPQLRHRRSPAMAGRGEGRAPRPTRSAAGGPLARWRLPAPRSRHLPTASTPKPRSASAAIGSCRRGSSRKRKKRCSRKPRAMPTSTPRTSAPPLPSLTARSERSGRSTFAALQSLLPFSRND